MDLTAITDWISQNPQWAYWVILAIAFTESLAVIGIFAPGWLLLVGVGFLIGTGTINYIMASIFCFTGAVTGEYLSFSVGKYFKDRVRHWPIFLRNPEWLSRTDHFFERFGVASLALGRFVGPVRAFVPLIAGMSSMPVPRYLMINVISGLIWAPLYLIPGVMVGASTQSEKEETWWLVGTIVLCSLAVWLAVVYLRNIWREQHHDEVHEYDKSHAVIKACSAAVVALISGWFLIFGPLHESFFMLANLMGEIVIA